MTLTICKLKLTIVHAGLQCGTPTLSAQHLDAVSASSSGACITLGRTWACKTVHETQTATAASLVVAELLPRVHKSCYL
jgi:hypothetical protein